MPNFDEVAVRQQQDPKLQMKTENGQLEVSMTSIELTEIINVFRREEGNAVEKRHSDLMASIATEINALSEANIPQRNFSPGSYKDKQNQERPCYSMNKAGALQMLNKESAVVRYKTVQYIEKLEQSLNGQPVTPMSMEDIIIYQMQQSKQMKEQLEVTKTVALEAKQEAAETKEELQGIRDAMLLDHDSWRRECNNIINKIAQERGGDYSGTNREVYSLVEKRAGANLNRRVINKQDRIRREGASKTMIKKVNAIEVIADDKRLKEIYIAIVKEMAIKYGIE